MNQHQLRTVRLNPTHNEGDDLLNQQEDVLIAAVGTFRRTTPGRSVQETLEAAGVALPTSRQTLRINEENLQDLGRILQSGDRVTIVNKVVGGSYFVQPIAC